VPQLARTLEQAGFESLWVSDHIVMPAAIGSRYPFSSDGRATWPGDTPCLDALVALALAAAVTERVRLGTAVLVLPLRHPVEFAKQAASIDVASGGRLELGLGAGWLAEEFAALNVPFAGRGDRLEEWVALARACWSGRPPASDSPRYTLPADVVCLPTPLRPVPLLFGGHSPRALRRAGRIGAGWLPQQSLAELSPETLAAELAVVGAAAERAGRDPATLRCVLRIVGAAGRATELALRLPELEAAGVSEIIIDAALDGGDPTADYAVLREAGS
jgi:probable F420-dependent oxidoreductase